MKIRKNKVIFIISLLISLLIVLFIISSNPIVSNKANVSEVLIEKIREQSIGTYSSRLPLLATFVTIDSYLGDRVYYTIYYFPFGTLGMSYSEIDGYNIEKPLTGW